MGVGAQLPELVETDVVINLNTHSLKLKTLLGCRKFSALENPSERAFPHGVHIHS